MLPNPGSGGLSGANRAKRGNPAPGAGQGRVVVGEMQCWRGLAGVGAFRPAIADPREGHAPPQIESGVRFGNPWGRHLKTEARTTAARRFFRMVAMRCAPVGCTPSAFRAGSRRCRDDFRHPLAPSPDNARNTSPREWAARMGQAGCNHSPGCADVDRPSPCHCMPRCRRAVPAGSGWCGTASLRLTDEGGGVSRDGMSAWTSRTRYRPLRARARQHRASGLERTNTGTHA